jgi:tRNA(Ile)-lysidine synthase
MTDKQSNSLSLPRGFVKYADLLGEYEKAVKGAFFGSCENDSDGSFPDDCEKTKEKSKNENDLPAPTVLVALSGGADSVALFDLTDRLCEAEGGHFYACHVNHGIRGDEAIRDRDFCISLAKGSKNCREIFVFDVDVPAIAKETGESLESAARRVRYEFFERVMEENGISVLATAHNADDNLETMLFNLVRGSGAKGMRGIPPVRKLSSGGVVVRPILKMAKSEILAYCESRGLEFVTDSTNFDTEYSRNLIRNEIVPLLERINPALRAHASALSDDMRELYSLAEKEAAGALDSRGLTVTSVLSLSPSALAESLSIAIGKSGFSSNLERVHVASIRELAEKGDDGSSVSLPNGVRVKISKGRLVFEADTREKTQKINYEIPLKKGKNLLPDGSVLLISDSDREGNIYKFATKLNADFDTINITAKNRREGDKIRQKGVNKSVKKLMCNQKLDSSLRNRIPLVFSDDELVCIPGVAVCDRAFIKNGKGILVAWLPKEEV